MDAKSLSGRLKWALIRYIRVNVDQLAEEVVDFDDATEVGGCDTCTRVVARVSVDYTVHPDLGEKYPRTYYHEQNMAEFIKELSDMEVSGALDC